MGSRVSSFGTHAVDSTTAAWIRNPFYDLSLVTGGAFFTLFVAAVAFQLPLLLPLFFWIWVVVFEGSHFWATFSRTYIDTKFRSENQRVLWGSLVFFLFPAAAVGLQQLMPSVAFTIYYGLFIFVWSLYHNARQHYGFFSIYAGKAGLDRELRSSLVKALYLCIGVAQIYFLLSFKVQGALGIAEIAGLAPIALGVSLVSFGYFFYQGSRAVSLMGYQRAFPVLWYILVCAVFYSTMFYFIAPQDLFIQGSDGTQKLMLIAIMNSLFHNIQYHAIVWHYSKSRYKNQPNENFGWARWVNSESFNYVAVALALGAVFGGIVWHLGDWPSISGSYTGVQAYTWAYVLYFGIVGHHFYLDQKIWRPSRQKDLSSYLYSTAN